MNVRFFAERIHIRNQTPAAVSLSSFSVEFLCFQITRSSLCHTISIIHFYFIYQRAPPRLFPAEIQKMVDLWNKMCTFHNDSSSSFQSKLHSTSKLSLAFAANNSSLQNSPTKRSTSQVISLMTNGDLT